MIESKEDPTTHHEHIKSLLEAQSKIFHPKIENSKKKRRAQRKEETIRF